MSTRESQFVATAGFGQRAERRRKRVTLLVAVALTAMVMTVAAAYWRGWARKERPLSVPQTLPTNVGQQLSGYTFTRSEGGRRIFTVHAARTVAFKQGGATVLEDVFVEVFGRAGNRQDDFRTSQCHYNSQTGELFASGKVEIELNANPEISHRAGLAAGSAAARGHQPVRLETAKVSFAQQGSLVESDEPVTFRIGSASGVAQGFEYGTRDGWLELKRNVVVNWGGQGLTAPPAPVKLTASRARYEKETGEVTLWGQIDITQTGRQVSAGHGVMILDTQNRVARAFLEASVRSSDSTEGSSKELTAQRVEAIFSPGGALRRLVAEGNVQADSRSREPSSRVINLKAAMLDLAFAGVHPQAQGGSASGGVQLSIQAPSGKASKPSERTAGGNLSTAREDLTTAALRFSFLPGGRSLHQAVTVGKGRLAVTPPDPKVGQRIITADPILLAFDAKNRLETLRGVSQVGIVFQPPPHAPPTSPVPESSSDRLEAKFDTTTETLQTVDQNGHFRFRDGDRQGSAEQARYESGTQVLAVVGHPEIWDATSRARADRVLIDLGTDTAQGLGHVQSTHRQDAGRSSVPGAGDPTNVVADRMTAERQSQFIHYEGHVRVWHRQDVTESSSLDVYKSERRVTSGFKVLTTHLQPALSSSSLAPASRPAAASRPATIRADYLDYFDEGREGNYRGNVQLQTEDVTLKADRLEVYFSGATPLEESEIERAVADGRVTVVEPSRRASGEHAEYFAASGKVVVTGGPPTLYDVVKGFTTGQRLTFFVHDDTVLVDGGGESPALSKHRIPR